jgi:hypothetical protein
MKIKVWVSTNRIGSKMSDTLEIDDEDVIDMSEEELEDYIDEFFQQWVWENIDAGWRKEDAGKIRWF